MIIVDTCSFFMKWAIFGQFRDGRRSYRPTRICTQSFPQVLWINERRVVHPVQATARASCPGGSPADPRRVAVHGLAQQAVAAGRHEFQRRSIVELQHHHHGRLTVPARPRDHTLDAFSDDAIAKSDVEPEVHDVAVAHDVVLALAAQLAGLLGALLALAGDEVVVGR
jgi:hypothetical protein